MIEARDDLVRRRPVWTALSELYLDSDEPGLLDRCARTLARSDYGPDELAEILRREIHPLLHANLLATTGVWQGFDPDWLEGEIVRRQARPRWLRPRGWIMRGLAEALWQELAPRIAAARAAASVNTPISGTIRP